MNTQPARQFCFHCVFNLIILSGLVIGSFIYLSFNPFKLLTGESIHLVAQYVARFFPPDVSSNFLLKVMKASLETIAISALATLIAMVFGLFLALPAAGWFGSLAKKITRFFLNFLRSVPELVFATLMVLAVGLGPFAGTLALLLHTTGVLGRLFGETLENHPITTNRALILSGASGPLAFLYGTLPGIVPQLISYTLYRWEMNIRMATILGFVGAGGLGQILYYELSLLHESQASTVIMVMLLLVIMVDFMSNTLRHGPARPLG
jgi:phosphonate transport system permease protein